MTCCSVRKTKSLEYSGQLSLESKYVIVIQNVAARWKTSVSIQIFSLRPSVKWPDQAKTNITSIALIKAQPRFCKNNDMATAVLRSEIRAGIELFHTVSCPMALACLHFSSSMDGLHKRHFLFPLNIKIMQSDMTKTSLPF